MFTEVVQDMLGKIPSVNFEKCYPRRLKKIFNKNYNYSTYDSFVPNTKGKIVGNLPHEIIDLFDRSDRPEKIKLFQKATSNITKYLRELYKTSKKENIIQYGFEDLDARNLKNLEKECSKLFNSMLHGVIPNNIKAKISYVGRGAWGNVFKFSLVDKSGKKIMHDKALKVFHAVKCPIKSLTKNQGVAAEANFWTFLKKNIGHKMDKTQFTRHYLSDLDSAYSITEFADKEIHPTTTPIDIERLFKIFYTDYSNEMINGKLYDVGGCIKYPNFIDDKVVLKYLKKLVHRNSEKDLKSFLEKLQKEVQNPKTPHRDKIQKALELFDKYNEPLY